MLPALTDALLPSHSKHLREPRFGEYNLFFTNHVKDTYLQDVAEADSQELVKQIHEFYLDYVILDPHIFEIPSQMKGTSAFLQAPYIDRQEILAEVDRTVESMSALLLSLKVRKPVIRYQKSSDVAYQVAESLYRLTYYQAGSLFATERGSSEPVVLVLDRNDDPITPLLSQWTYQAMVHELIGISNNRIDLSNAPKVPKDQKQVVLSSYQDEFFRGQMYNNYGDLGTEIKNLVDSFQEQSKMNHNIQTIEDMQRFVENYPEFRSKQGNVSKHVTLMTELSRQIDQRNLMTVSELEQEIACNATSSSICDEVISLIKDPSVQKNDKVRLAMLVCIKFDREADMISRVVSALIDSGVAARKAGLVRTVVDYGGTGKRSGDLFGSRNFFSRAQTAVKGLKGVDNVYTQHQPHVSSIVDQLLKGKLKESEYPFHSQVPVIDCKNAKDIIVVITGGVTYEESRAVAALNASFPGIRVFLGGNGILNSKLYLEALEERERFANA